MKRGREASVSVSAPKDIDLIIFRFLHRDLMKQLNLEYHQKVKCCKCLRWEIGCGGYNNVCTYFINAKLVQNHRRVGNEYQNAYNYRSITSMDRPFVVYSIFNVYNEQCAYLSANY